MIRRLPMLVAGCIAIAWAIPAHAQSGRPPLDSSTTPARASLNKYCVTCHNSKLKIAGLDLASLALTDVGAGAEVWEKVVRKLRTGAMPPPNVPRPDQATYDSLASWLENALDRAAADKPDPGKLPPLRRLTRTEYQNAIRDLLALEYLPKEMDVSLLLPADNSQSGFDNIADLLFVSPASLERYLAAARKISRLAVGDPDIPVLVGAYHLSPDQPQDVQLEDAPFGTRGGTMIHANFPLNGEYAFKIEFSGNAREAHQLEVSLDGERIKLFTVGDKPAPRRGSGVYTAQPDDPVEVRLPVKAGAREVGVTFLQKTAAEGEEVVRPYTRGRGALPAIASVTISGPYSPTGPGDTPNRNRIFVCYPASAAEETPCAKRILSALASRAYRRPSTNADVSQLLPFYAAGRKDASFDVGIGKALERLLVSPQFLFRIERGPAKAGPNGVAPVSGLELASRLSFFLWSSIPDEELLNLAAQGRLQDAAVLAQQVKRMLADSRAESMVNNFAAQWLYLHDVDAKRPDPRLFPDFDENLRQAFVRETELLFGSVLHENRSVLDLLTADYTFVNERLAKHYGIPNVYGPDFRRVEIPNQNRRGLLGEGSFLLLTSYSTRTSPVLRGKWILENILASPPPPPPPDVPALKTENTGGEALSIREAMERHRANPVCASCHARMDPLGFAFENFDAVGRWQTQADSGDLIDSSGILPDGTRIEGPAGLRTVLVRHPKQFAGTVTEKLLTYATGRTLQYFDQPAIRKIVRDSAGSNYTLSSLILGVVNSTPFQMRKFEGAPASAALTGPGH
jgi:mono/diheme cytochrome c family protein